MAKIATSPKRRNPQDATLRNVRATRKREATLEERVARLEIAVARLICDARPPRTAPVFRVHPAQETPMPKKRKKGC